MSKIKLITSFARLSDAELETKAQIILGQLTDNPAFPAPTPSLQQLREAKDAYETALMQTGSGSKEKTLIKNQKRDALETLLGKLGIFLELNAGDNEAALLTTGFDIAKKPTPIGDLPKPEKFITSEGANAGEVDVTISGIKGAKAYLVQFTLEPMAVTSVWQSVPITKTKGTIKNLQSGKRYWFRAAAVGATDTLNYSDAVSRIVQ